MAVSKEQTKKRRVLILPDSMFCNNSGSVSARASVQALVEGGYSVSVLTKSDDDAVDLRVASQVERIYFLEKPFRWFRNIKSRSAVRQIEQICDEFSPEVALFIGSMGKSRVLASQLRKRGVKVGYLFYINDYFCHRVYASLESEPCSECSFQNSFPALRNRCVKGDEVNSFLVNWLSRLLFGLEIKKGFLLLGYANSQLDRYRHAGLSAKKGVVIDFQFDPTEVIEFLDKFDNSPVDSYIALAGQAIDQKGWALLPEILRLLPDDIRVVASMPSLASSREVFKAYGLESFVAQGKLATRTDLADRGSYLGFLKQSRAVIIPTCYHTTGEFVLQEAMCLGKVVHAFDVGVHAEKLTDNYNACVTNVTDLVGYVEKIVHFFNDEKESSRLECNATSTSIAWYDAGQDTAIARALDAVLQC